MWINNDIHHIIKHWSWPLKQCLRTSSLFIWFGKVTELGLNAPWMFWEAFRSIAACRKLREFRSHVLLQQLCLLVLWHLLFTSDVCKKGSFKRFNIYCINTYPINSNLFKRCKGLLFKFREPHETFWEIVTFVWNKKAAGKKIFWHQALVQRAQ